MSENYISQAVKNARGELSYRAFADKCNLSHAYLHKIEVGHYRGKPVCITLDTLSKLAKGGVRFHHKDLIHFITGDSEETIFIVDYCDEYYKLAAVLITWIERIVSYEATLRKPK